MISAAAILKPLLLCLCGIFFLYISFILLLAIPALQDLVIFLHKVPLTFKDANVPEQWGFLRGQVTTFNLKTTDGETLHAWHVLPLDIYNKYHEELRNEPAGLRANVEESLAFRILKNDPEAQVVLYFHGAAGTLGSTWRPQSYCAVSAACPNVHVLVIDYRGYGRSTGWPSEAGLASDARALANFAMKKCGIPPERIVVFGQSIGTAVALALIHEFATKTPPILFAGTILVAPFADVESLTRTYKIAGIIPLLSPVAYFPKLLALLNRCIRTKFDSKNMPVDSKRRKYHVTLIHAEDDYDIPWIHSNVLFWHAVNAILEPSASISFEDVEKVKEKQKTPLGAGGWQMEWEGKGGVVREEIVKHGLHDRIMSYPVVSLAVSRAFHSQDEE
ncbi:Alpha/Beta hydrolase protein [Paraphoma chrysanthemicola]|uniref:Alpha/Beta hydrolase protein n=1 Tax=Paraphoma chrysanthemicola TaxID=798071 RepID=A0A8K0W2C8_9PLEO|nr:Alpha/Beta hydrolase protein [Paraphoma chrysanthemicola]